MAERNQDGPSYQRRNLFCYQIKKELASVSFEDIISLPINRSGPTSALQTMQTLAQQIADEIDSLATFELRMIAEAIVELLIEEVISEREAKRQLTANGITLSL